ncbi:tRNA 2'-phosphotransferase 1 [Hermetia illucens]|uniref:tRNA 2'-phosphotransferase 1 n=1 Tax=Hermetia illucens TaxID=343691 RepID=UPI0018CC2AD4|nr:tRNA 2'-phosphotransferase 1 [Hermetia illucens]
MARNTNADTGLSKTLSWLLRHGAVKEGLNVGSDGFLDVQEVVAHSSMKRRKCSEADILRVVANDQKGRYVTKREEASGRFLIKATQGHSFQVDDLSLREISEASDLPRAIHGTYMRFWDKIKVEGLKRMNRYHIHFTSSEVPVNSRTPLHGQVTSGFRNNCDLLIYVDVPEAMRAGVKFYLSENNVILTSGLDGTLPPRFLLKAVNRRTGQLLHPPAAN